LTQYQTSSSVDDCLKPNDAALWLMLCHLMYDLLSNLMSYLMSDIMSYLMPDLMSNLMSI